MTVRRVLAVRSAAGAADARRCALTGPAAHTAGNNIDAMTAALGSGLPGLFALRLGNKASELAFKTQVKIGHFQSKTEQQ